jgi:hypothetical protein
VHTSRRTRRGRSSVTRQPVGGQTAKSPTPSPGRDRFIDLIRLLAVTVVVIEHWLMPVLSFDAGQLTTGNALSAPGGWIITWFGQVMPLVFFAGGAANAMSWHAHQQRGDTAHCWLTKRIRRIAWPLLPLASVWIPLPHALVALGAPEQPVATAAHIVGQLVWFLAAYLLAIVVTPVLAPLSSSRGVLIPLGLALGAVAVDVVRFVWSESAGYLNVAFVFLAVHQLGIMYADGRLHALPQRRIAAIGAASFAGVALLVGTGPYPRSMIGMPGAPSSNMSPPSVCLLLIGLGQVAVALLLRPLLVRFAMRPHVDAMMRWSTPRIMTIYLWHMPALVVVAGITVVVLGSSTPPIFGAAWWLTAPVWLAALALTLAGLLRVFSRYEQPPAVHSRAPLPAARVAAASALVGAGLVGLMTAGFQPQHGIALLISPPIPAVIALALGLRLTRPPASREALNAHDMNDAP